VAARVQVLPPAAGDLLDLENGQPPAAVDFLGQPRDVWLGRGDPSAEVVGLGGGEQTRPAEGGEKDGRRVGGAHFVDTGRLAQGDVLVLYRPPRADGRMPP